MAGGVIEGDSDGCESGLSVRRVSTGWSDLARRSWSVAQDVLFPIGCLGCNRRGRYICAACVERMPKLERPFCTVCASPGINGICSWCREHSPSIDTIRSPYLYVPQSPIYRAITKLKYRGLRSIAPELADLLYKFLSSRRGAQSDIVVPVPSHPSRMRQRGYGQAALIAAALAKRLDSPVNTHDLRRIVNAPSQLETDSREERWTQVSGGFEAEPRFSGANVLLVDDLVTTGSTASACADALKRAGARRVVGLSVARAP